MNRKDFLKKVSTVGAITLLPKIALTTNLIQQSKFHFIGIGSAGNNALLEFHKNNVNGTFTAIHICIKEYVIQSKKKNIHSCIWQQRYTEEENWDLIKSQIQKQFYNKRDTNDHYVLLAGLGGLTGTTLLSIISSLLQYENKLCTIICTVPFNFEGIKPRLASYQFIKENKTNKNVHFIYADTLRKKYPGLKFKDCFSTLDNEMLQMWLRKSTYHLNKF